MTFTGGHCDECGDSLTGKERVITDEAIGRKRLVFCSPTCIVLYWEQQPKGEANEVQKPILRE